MTVNDILEEIDNRIVDLTAQAKEEPGKGVSHIHTAILAEIEGLVSLKEWIEEY